MKYYFWLQGTLPGDCHGYASQWHNCIKDVYKVPFRGSTERAPTETKKLSLVVKQKKLNNLREKVKFRLHFVPLNMTLIILKGIHNGASAEISPRASLGRNDVIQQKFALFSWFPNYVRRSLTHLKYTSRLQTVDLLHSGWRGVTLQRHLNEGAAG